MSKTVKFTELEFLTKLNYFFIIIHSITNQKIETFKYYDL